MKAYGTNILVKEIEEENESEGGIALVGNPTVKKAKVISVGAEVEEIKAGDIIYYQFYDVDFKEFVVVSKDNVFLIEPANKEIKTQIKTQTKNRHRVSFPV